MKLCYKCKKTLPLELFSKNSRRKDGLQTKCKPCTKAYYKNYYNTVPKEKARILVKNKDYREELKRIVQELKSVPCMDCKQTYPYFVMDFDHQYDKKFQIATAVAQSMPLARILTEIEKCEVVCANCHRIRTHA
jgi:hypothetical protein